MGVQIPDKLYFKIGEVAQLAGVKPSVLRFWETEFIFLRPEKSTTGQRLYSRREVELVLQVRRLLYDERFTIEGVKQRISSKGKLIGVAEPPVPVTAVTTDLQSVLCDVRIALQKLRNQL